MIDLKSLIPFGHKSQKVAVRDERLRDPFTAFRQEMDRLFDDFFANTALTLREMPQPLVPQLDVVEDDKQMVVEVELPGMDEDDVEITLSGDLLTISGEKKDEHEEKKDNRHYVERSYGAFTRTIRLPFQADSDKVSATFDKGVLKIQIEKPEALQQQVRRIEVKSA